jgi:hypothetical protein
MFSRPRPIHSGRGTSHSRHKRRRCSLREPRRRVALARKIGLGEKRLAPGTGD